MCANMSLLIENFRSDAKTMCLLCFAFDMDEFVRYYYFVFVYVCEIIMLFYDIRNQF